LTANKCTRTYLGRDGCNHSKNPPCRKISTSLYNLALADLISAPKMEGSSICTRILLFKIVKYYNIPGNAFPKSTPNSLYLNHCERIKITHLLLSRKLELGPNMKKDIMCFSMVHLTVADTHMGWHRNNLLPLVYLLL
jgi:hypothetical protein